MSIFKTKTKRQFVFYTRIWFICKFVTMACIAKTSKSWVSSAVPCAELPEVSISQWDYLLSVSPAHCLKNQLLWKSLFYTHWCTVCRVTHAKQTVLCRTSRTTFGDPLSVNTAVIHPAQPHDEPMAGQTQQKPCTSSSWASLWPSHSQLISTAFDLLEQRWLNQRRSNFKEVCHLLSLILTRSLIYRVTISGRHFTWVWDGAVCLTNGRRGGGGSLFLLFPKSIVSLSTL